MCCEQFENRETNGLEIAAANDDLDLLEYLLSCLGVDVNKAPETWTPLLHGCHEGNERIVRRLIQAVEKSKSSISKEHS